MARRGRISLTGDSQRNGPASFQQKSSNSKLSEVELIPYKNGRFQTKPKPPFVSSTYVSIDATCPDECRFKNAGCYVQVGNAGSAMRHLDEEARATRTMHPNILEANLIDRQWGSPYHIQPRLIPQDGARGGRDLRLHVGGDARDRVGAKALASAAVHWRHRGGGLVWTYTHRWRELKVSDWGDCISALASVETLAEAEEAVDLGYMPSFTMASFESDRAYKMGSIKVTPCPAQTRGVKCIQCRLCFQQLPTGQAIGFQWHGRGSEGKRRLEVIQREQYGQARFEGL